LVNALRSDTERWLILGEGSHWESPSIINNRLRYHPRLAGGFRFDGTSFCALLALQTSRQPRVPPLREVVADRTVSVPISGFALGNTQYVYFCGSDDDVHEYSYGDGGNWSWVDRNLNALVGGGAANCSMFSNGLIAYATPKNSQRHVFYQPSFGPNDIYQLALKGSSWYAEDETLATHGAKGDGTWMAGFAIGNAQYAYFEDEKGNIHEYSYGDGGNWNWVDKNLTAVTKGPKSATYLLAGVTAFVIPGTLRKEVYYGTSSFDLHQMTFRNKKWTDTDIGGPGPQYQSQMVGFATTPNDQFHVYEESIAGGQGVYQLYFNGSWSSQELASVATVGGMTGFAINNLQYVYYMTLD
jgi:hypothetical protein